MFMEISTSILYELNVSLADHFYQQKKFLTLPKLNSILLR